MISRKYIWEYIIFLHTQWLVLKRRKGTLCIAVYQLPCISFHSLWVDGLNSVFLGPWIRWSEGEVFKLPTTLRQKASLTQYVEWWNVTIFSIKLFFFLVLLWESITDIMFASVRRNLGGLTYLEQSLFLHWYKSWFCLFSLKVLVTSYLKNITEARQKKVCFVGFLQQMMFVVGMQAGK